MACIFCIAALTIAAGTIIPALVDSMQGSLTDLAADIKRVGDSDSAVMWSGTFAFKAMDGTTKRATANVTVYKESKRARIQVTTHEFSRADNEVVENLIANALGAQILNRHDAHEGLLTSEALQQVARSDGDDHSDPIPLAPEHAVEP